jgi:hypothetical protein
MEQEAAPNKIMLLIDIYTVVLDFNFFIRAKIEVCFLMQN